MDMQQEVAYRLIFFEHARRTAEGSDLMGWCVSEFVSVSECFGIQMLLEVIQRKLVQVFTASTSIDDTIVPDAVHLLVIKEGNGSTVYGFAFVDCATLKFWIGSINDDASSASLGARLMQVSLKEVIYESEGLSKEAKKALRKYPLTEKEMEDRTLTLCEEKMMWKILACWKRFIKEGKRINSGDNSGFEKRRQLHRLAGGREMNQHWGRFWFGKDKTALPFSGRKVAIC